MSKRATLAAIVADSLRQALKAGDYLCGAPLAEITVAQEMNVSQSTARDALRILESEGWLHKPPRRKMQVRAFDVPEAQELYTLRITLEELALHWAMDTMTTAHHMELSQLVAEARIRAGMGDDAAVRDALFVFHEAILCHTQRPITTTTLMPLLNAARLLDNLRARYEPDDDDAYTERIAFYGDLLTAIRYNDREKASTTLQTLLEAEKRLILLVLDLVK